MIKLLLKVVFVSVLFGPNISSADTPEEGLLSLYGDENFVSIATGRKQLISRAPAVASVITAKDIREMGAKDLDEVLEAVPGLHVSVKAGGYNPIYTIRGIHSEFNPQVLVLINGLPATSVLFGDRGQVWAGMPVENISRVEVIRGPGSAIFGADAFAGTINVITKTSVEIDGVETGVSAGSFDTKRAWLQYGGESNDWEIAFSMEVLSTDGQDEEISSDLQSALDVPSGTSASQAPGELNLERKSIDARLDLAKDNWRIRMGYQGRKDAGIGAGANGSLDPLGEGNGRRINFDLIYDDKDFAENWELKGTLSYFDVANKLNLFLSPPGSDFTALGGFAFPDGIIGNPDTYERHTRFELSSFFTGFENHDVRIGAGYSHQDQYKVEESKNFFVVLTPSGPAPVPLGSVVDVSETMPFNQEKVREIRYLFLQDEWRLAPDWSLTGGVRYDHYSDFGGTVNPRVALVWNTTYRLTSKLLYGRAFRAPSFAEQFNINNPVAVGNEDLDPETINTYELAFDYVFSNELRSGLNLFYYEMQDIIRFNPTVADNTGDQRGHGLEWEFEWDTTDNLTLVGNYAYQKSEDEDSNSDAPNAPGQQVYLRADYQVAPKWVLNSQVNWVMGRERAVGDTRSDVGDYTTMDVSLRAKEVFLGIEMAFSLRNLTDEDVFEPSLAPGNIPNDLPQAGRSFTAEIRKIW